MFVDFLMKWNDKPSGDKTFLNLKTHMRNVHASLNNVGKLKIKDSTINIMEKLTAHQEQLANDLCENLANTVHANSVTALDHLDID